MKIIHKLEMELTERGLAQKIDVVQGDCNTRILELSLRSNGEEWPVPEGVTVRLRYCKSDGTKGIYDTLPDGSTAWSVEGNCVTISLAPQMLTAPGMVLAQVVLIGGTAELAAFAVQIHVERNPAAGAMESEDYLNMLQWMETELDRLLQEAKESGEFNGPQGPQGPEGPEGPQGPQGEAAEPIFTYATNAGYTGTEEEFQEMLITPCLPVTGGTMQGEVNMGGQKLTGLATPTADTDAATKAYADTKFRWSYATLRTANWSSTAPYSITVGISGAKYDDYIRLLPSYTGALETDLKLKKAWDCVTYATASTNSITVVCLEEKPTVNLTVLVELMR